MTNSDRHYLVTLVVTQGVPLICAVYWEKIGGESISTEEVKGILEEFIQEKGNYVFQAEFPALSDKEKLISVDLAAMGLNTVPPNQ